MKAIEKVTAAGTALPRDLGGNASTMQVTNAVCEAVRSLYPQQPS
jgi:isocitrate/isopropylmalate dehydrogenase